MRSTFQETVLHETSVFKKVDVVGLLGRVDLGVSGNISVSL